MKKRKRVTQRTLITAIHSCSPDAPISVAIAQEIKDGAIVRPGGFKISLPAVGNRNPLRLRREVARRERSYENPARCLIVPRLCQERNPPAVRRKPAGVNAVFVSCNLCAGARRQIEAVRGPRFA